MHKLSILFILFSSFLVTAKEHVGGNQQVARSGARKTTAVQERLIGFSYRNLSAPATILDTATYWYSGGRGSDSIVWSSQIVPIIETPNTQNIKCDSFIYKLFNSTSGAITYNSDNFAICDKRYDTSGSGSGTLIPVSSHFFYYNAASQMNNDSEYFVSGSQIYNNYHFYDGSGNIIEDSQYNVASSLPVYKAMYTYDGTGKLLNYMNYTWVSPGGLWMPTNQGLYTYDAANHVSVFVLQSFSAGTWTNSRKDSTYYPGAGSRFTYQCTYNWPSSGSWQPAGANSLHVNTSNQWDTVTFYNWNTTTLVYDTMEKDYQSYDGFGNLQYEGGIAYNAATGTFADTAYDRNTYYYETYSPAGISVAPVAQVAVNIFPNPVSNRLYISVSGMAAGQKATVTVINLLGQKMAAAEVNMAATTVIDLSAYAPGDYIVSVTGDGLHYTDKIVKSK